MKKFRGKLGVALLCVCMLAAFGGCASFGVWSTTAQNDIMAFQTWADQWISGALAEAPAIIAAAAAIPGVNKTIVTAASDAVAAAKGAVSVLDAVAAGASVNTAAATETSVVTAINNVNSTIGAVQTVIAAVNPPAVIPAPAAATGSK
jgi:hypothetical protein